MFKCPECGYLGFEEERQCPKCGTVVSHLNSGDETNALIQPPSVEENAPPAVQEAGPHLIDTPENILELEQKPSTVNHVSISTEKEEPKTTENLKESFSVVNQEILKPLEGDDKREFKLVAGTIQQELPISHKERGTQEELQFHPKILTRTLAFLVDFILIAGITTIFILSPIVMGANNFISLKELAGIFLFPFYLLFVILHILYHTYFLTLTGQTPGKSLFNLKVVSRGGLSLEWHEALLRALAYLLSLIPGGFGFLWALFDKKKEALHDKLTGSKVIYLGS